jgi:hypothetical protein
VNNESAVPFETIESAQEYLSLLSQELEESLQAVEADIRAHASSAPSRHLDALRLISYNLQKLNSHLKRSRLILNDLRTLRRRLHQERTQIAA